MQHVGLSQPHGAMLRAPLVVGAPREGGWAIVQRLGRGLECNGSMAIMWAGLACMEPREKSKGLGGMVRLQAYVQSVVGEYGPLSVRFRWSKAAQEHSHLKTLGAMLIGQLVRGGGGGAWDTLQHLGRGLECNATMAFIWSSLAGVEPRKKSKGLGT